MSEPTRMTVPGDKSISHRALMLAPLATGTSRVTGISTGADVRATATAMRALGIPYDREDLAAGRFEITGPLPFRSPGASLDCGNSGTTARILLGLLAGQPLTARMDGDASLRRRPMDRVIVPLRAAGARIRELEEPGRLPLEVTGGSLGPIEHQSPVASAQVKSALLLAGLSDGVPVRVVEPGPSRDHTERMLSAMGAPVTTEARGEVRDIRLGVSPGPLRPLEFHVPGDISSAAFFIALALLGGAGPGLRIEGVGLNPYRTGFLRTLEEMGAELEVRATGEVLGEPVGAVIARPSALHGVEVSPDVLPSLLDEVPILAVLAARARGTTVIRGAAELRVKETDRIAALARNLSTLGVAVQERPDGLAVMGGDGALHGTATTDGDHRIAMAFAVLGAAPGNRVRVDDTGCAAVSYPAFWEDLSRYGTGAART